MKKTSILALALMAVFALASCNRQEIDPPQEGVQGKYLLTEITAYTGDDDTKTVMLSSGVVNWGADDQLAVKGTDGALHYYKIVSGSGTPVGKFLPATGQTPASYNSISDLTAIYPACSAELSGGDLYVNINNLDLSGSYANRGLKYWSELSPYTFTNNDIKVAVPSRTSLDGNGELNFKFKQLGTRCKFLFDFTQADIAPTLIMESIERIQVSTLEGAPISGRAKVVGTSLGEVSSPKTLVDVLFPVPISMSSEVEFVHIMYPVVTTNTTLQLSVTTTDHEFVFTGKPTQDFEGGKTLTFPVTVDKNFEVGGMNLAYTSTARAGMEQFYYYGGTNCLLLPTTNTMGYLDVTQYVTDSRWHNTKNSSDVLNQKPAVYAKIIWSEKADVIASDMIDASNGYKLKLPSSPAGAADAISVLDGKSTLSIKRGSAAGNALVGIYDSFNNLLWSYHIWCPEDDPTDGMYSYTKTNSGSYTVMTMPIGAIKKASSGMSNPATAVGFYYQWGRKDPLGRPTNFSSTNGGDIMNVLGSDQTTALNIGDSDYSIAGGNLKDCEIWFSNSNGNAVNNVLHNAWSDDLGITRERFMIEYTVSKPWMYILCDDSQFGNSWIPQDDWLWGNGYDRYDYPVMEATYKSIFDPSPEGYRVAPRDLWVCFTKTNTNADARNYSGAALEEYKNTNFNTTSISISAANNANGYSFYYQGWKTGPTEFYLAAGNRNRDNGSVTGVSTVGSVWSSSNNGTDGGRLAFSANYLMPITGMQRAYGYTVLCVKEQ